MIYIIFLIIGFLAGFILKNFERLKIILKKWQGISITILMLITGVSVGLDKSVGSKFGAVGVISVVFAIGTSIGSVVVVYLFTKRLDGRRKK
ncbi:MAG: LysO family transporter [Sarcina sp.]